MAGGRKRSLFAVLSASVVAVQLLPAHVLANPPSDYCAKLGGKPVAEKRSDGVDIDVCTFEGGGQCEAWALYRLQCPPGGVKLEAGMSSAARYCVLRGGKYSASGKGQCTFDTGQVCSIDGYFIGRCE